MRHTSEFKSVSVLLMLALLSGCVAAPAVLMAANGAGLVAGGVGLYNLANPEKNVTLTVDANGLERLRSQLKGVNHLVLLDKKEGSLSSVAFSETWERAGKRASIFTDSGNPANMSLSQARAVMAAACKSGVDAVTYARSGAVDVDRLGMFVAKMDTKIDGDIYVFNCRLGRLESASVSIAFNAIGQDPGQADRSVGAGLAAKLLEIAKLDEGPKASNKETATRAMSPTVTAVATDRTSAKRKTAAGKTKATAPATTDASAAKPTKKTVPSSANAVVATDL